MKEILPGTHDKVAAEKEFLEIFKNADSKAKGKLIKFFLKGFHFADKKRFGLLNAWSAALANLRETKNNLNQESTAEHLGAALGYFLTGVEWLIRDRSLIPDRFFEDSLRTAENIASEFKAQNRSVKLKFIKNRILAISRKNAGTLSSKKQEFIAKVASLFM